MSNKPKRKKPMVRSTAMNRAMFENIMETEGGQIIAAEVSEIFDFCKEHDLDFDQVSKLFDNYSKMSPYDLVSTVKAFKRTLIERFHALNPEGESPKLILPGDKDFQLPTT